MASATASSAPAKRLSVNAIIAFVLSAIGLLFPFGLWLGYRTRARIDKGNGEYGREFATAAIIIGWLWLTFFVLGLLAYLWILI
ncbi:DUF4190 domain-containing protein [Gordonia hydrophobica]|uniref:DUF4190 domain-containing protein n=1 Tax=Gordonia hydrophobica TaxID=40516 RepID=A0ABZ2U5I0_9ACTN|nr:DUF4190 domain-containing protein [Gordonia hydrophobica]MBM7368679.1 hypothetical protein [Gordonia hydrophobica]